MLFFHFFNVFLIIFPFLLLTFPLYPLRKRFFIFSSLDFLFLLFLSPFPFFISLFSNKMLFFFFAKIHKYHLRKIIMLELRRIIIVYKTLPSSIYHYMDLISNYYYYVHFLIRNVLIWYILNDSFSLDFINEFLSFFKVFLIFFSFSFINLSSLSLMNNILIFSSLSFFLYYFFYQVPLSFFSLFSSNKIFLA